MQLAKLPNRYSIAKSILLKDKAHVFNFQTKQLEFADRLDIFNIGGRRIGFYGGSMGGGKTFVNVGLFTELALLYPGSIWTIVRESRKRCEDTVVQDFKKIAKGLYYDFNDQKLIAYFANGSKIEFKGENIDKDPDLDAWKSYSTNGVFFEQLEEIQRKTFDMALIRTGRNRISPMPPQIVTGTINPSISWVKESIYEAWINDKLPDNWFYIPALIEDNRYLSDDKVYMASFDKLDPLTKKRYLEGNWSAFATERPFMYCFDINKHVSEQMEYNPRETIYISFDFNVNPITCIIAQMGHDWVHILDEFRIMDSNTYELCDRILASPYANSMKVVTGDASGVHRTTTTKGNVNNYTIICDKLRLNPHSQLRLPNQNPPISESQTLCNSLYSNHPKYLIHKRCKYLIEDNQFVQVNDRGDIDKSKDVHRSHLLDCQRYLNNTFLGDFILRGFHLKK